MDDREKYIERIQKMLMEKTYFVPRHNLVRINDSGKERTIIKPFYCYEQIVHHAMIQVMMPMFMRGMYAYSCGSVPGRGGLYGKKYIEKFIKENPADVKYCLKMDIRHFFQSIPHEELKAMLRKRIKDQDMMWLNELIIDSYEDTERRGIPLGYYTSQWYANYYLQGLDHYIKRTARCYVRYMDDMVVFGRNKKELHSLRKRVDSYLKGLRLEMKGNWQVFRFEYVYRGKRRGRELDFMGFLFYRHKTLMRKAIMVKACRKAKKQNMTWYDASQMLSRLAWFKHTNSYQCFLKHVKPFVDVRKLRKKISQHDRRVNNDLLRIERHADRKTA